MKKVNIPGKIRLVFGNRLRAVVVCLAMVLFSAFAVMANTSPAYATGSIAPGGSSTQTCEEGDKDCSRLIERYINPIIKLLGGLVGIVVTISIIAAGIQYSTARDETRTVTVAKQRIEKALTALLAYFLLVAFLQWLIPGGVI